MEGVKTMNIIVKTALAGGIRALIGNSNWGNVRTVVQKLESSDISGEEKRALAITAIKETGWNLAGILLNVAIEIAALLLESTAKKLESGRPAGRPYRGARKG
jgi:hypothetical protein